MNQVSNCHHVEQQLACNQPLTVAQQTHLAGCPACRGKQAAYLQLDQRLMTAFETRIPDDFTDRLMVLIEQEPTADAMPRMERLLASLPFRVGLITAAILVLLGHIVRFFLTALVVTMAAT